MNQLRFLFSEEKTKHLLNKKSIIIYINISFDEIFQNVIEIMNTSNRNIKNMTPREIRDLPIKQIKDKEDEIKKMKVMINKLKKQTKKQKKSFKLQTDIVDLDLISVIFFILNLNRVILRS